MHSSLNPFGSPAVLVDKLIGNAYKIVEYVARNMTHIRRASFYMKNIYDASQRLTKLVTAVSPDTDNSFIEIELPAVLIEGESGVVSSRTLRVQDVVGWTVILTDSNGVVYCDRHDLWTSNITVDGMFRITLPEDAPAVILEAPMKILIDFTIPPETI